MQELVGNRVLVADTTGYLIEGDLDRIDYEGSIGWACLSSSRQINYLNMEENPPSVDGWEIPGVVRVATHLIARIHLTHLGGEGGASKVTRGPTPPTKKRKAVPS